jgi:hypothetical protein
MYIPYVCNFVFSYVIIIRHELGHDRPVRPRLMFFSKVFQVFVHSALFFGILLFILVTCRSQFDLCLMSLLSALSASSSSKIFSFLLW